MGFLKFIKIDELSKQDKAALKKMLKEDKTAIGNSLAKLTKGKSKKTKKAPKAKK